MSSDVDRAVKIARRHMRIAQLDAERRTLLIVSQSFVCAGLALMILSRSFDSFGLVPSWIAIGVSFISIGWRFRLSRQRAALAHERSRHVEAALLSSLPQSAALSTDHT